ncbi:whirlin isoform X2 [Lucilia cuprina]|uniref:whirlin isoform X2 n=1 Tax=Lucilia cuprina TaxID=7375 RepID=UPI001F063D82|nr:whirlin isoform X2 [Lucilia cuprina]
MRLGGGVPYDGDPPTMSATGNDYAELCDLGPTRWSSRGYYHVPPPAAHSSSLHPSILQTSTQSSSSVPTGGSAGLTAHHLRATHPPPPTSSYEAEDIGGTTYGMTTPPPGVSGLTSSYAVNSRIGNSTSSLRTGSAAAAVAAGVGVSSAGVGGRPGLYYSPPGTSYTIIERPHSPHYYYNSAGVATKGGSLPGRGSAYLSSSPSNFMNSMSGTLPTSTAARHGLATGSAAANGNKKRPISPEQVLRMFGATQSSSVPTSSYHYSNGTRDRTGRRSPASSPPSTTHQIYRERERDRGIPSMHDLTTRTVNMSRDQQIDHGFGICVKGGKDSGLGVYISRIEENSVAERAGLRPGDTILEVNGTPFTSINHEEALKRCVQILKSSRQISMTVRAPPTLNSTAPLHGFGPPSRDPMYASMAPLLPQQSALPPGASIGTSPSGGPLPYRQTCSWMDRHGRPASPPMEYGGRRSERRDRIRRVELLIEPGQSLGLMIRGGVEYGLGIFVTGVDKESVADRAGLMVGDEILEVNGQSFQDVTHDEAVSQLKYHKRMSLVIRDVGKVPHSCTSIEMEPYDAYSPTGTRARRKGQITAMVEEKARSLLPRHHFASLSYYIAEYCAKAMTIDAFVAVLLEMLDTYEKHTLVTEIRELIFPEDRTRYDELVYRRERDPYSGERLRRKGESARDLPEQELATKLSRSFDMKEEGGTLLGDKGVRRHQSMQRLSAEQQQQNGSTTEQTTHEHNPNVVPDHRGNLHVTVKKTKPILGIAIEGGANTKHPLPRIINIHENGAAFEAGGLEVGQLILEVDGNKVEGLHHQEVARLIAECFANREKADITFLVVEAKKSNLEPKPTALIFLEA